VPLVELRTVNEIRYYTDSNGVVAFCEPDLMNQTVFFHIRSHGYEFPKDGFGYCGKALKATEGGSAQLKIRRINIAERLYRLTGAGVYRDSAIAGDPVPTKRPLLNGLVLGSDSVVNAVYRGKVYWFWGDTNQPAYPLGNFHVPGATSLLPQDGGLEPEVGVDLDYFLNEKGFAKETARMPGDGPTWISALTVLRDAAGRERMFAAYAKVRRFLDVYQRGLVEFDDQKQQFEKVAQFDIQAPVYPDGHPFQRVENGVERVYFANPYPLIRVRAAPESLQSLSDYESFTCLEPGSRIGEARLDRASDGSLRYGWKKNAPPVGPGEQAKLVKAGQMKPDEALLQLQDADTGQLVTAHAGSVYWNDYRGRWAMIVEQADGASRLGEIWFAEADSPLGPWVYARKIVTHDKYSFYNPKQHPMFDKEGGRVIFFEGTYSTFFSGNPDPTPRYDYNQILYKLDLSNPRLVLPAPIYERFDQDEGSRLGSAPGLGPERGPRKIAFFAPDRPGPGCVPVHEWRNEGGAVALKLGPPPPQSAGGDPAPVFYALPSKTADPPATTTPLYEFVSNDDMRRTYSTGAAGSMADWRRSEEPLCLVWRNPMGPALSTLDWQSP